jgi:phosphotransferase family enzyme
MPLTGGRVNEGVVRVGETVRRPLRARSAFVHELLQHLERVGFDGAPRFGGIDGRGREILSFLPGTPLPGTTILRDAAIVSAARLVRRYHDAAASFPAARETVVHGDPGPWNILWTGDRAVALIDFDEARPGGRLEDLGYLAWKGLRLVPEGPPVDEQRRRLALLAETYGARVDGELLDALEAAVGWLREKGVRDGWQADVLERLDLERRWVRAQRAALLGRRA